MRLPNLTSDAGPLGQVSSIGTPALFLAAIAALRLACTHTVYEDCHREYDDCHKLYNASSLLHISAAEFFFLHSNLNV